MRTGRLLLDGKPWVERVERAAGLLERLQGLLGRDGLPAGRGLLIERCRAVHTIGMRFALDVVFLDRKWRVCRVRRAVPPGRPVVWGGWPAVRALEVAAGWLDVTTAETGTATRWEAE
jgi:uncharacterized membrane protein (UPF0127 family)